MKKIFMAMLILTLTHFSFAQSICTPTEVLTEVTIETPVNEVWKLLLATNDYPSWHPFLNEVSGEVKKGKMLHFKYTDANGKLKKFKAKVLEIEPNKSFSWGGSVGFIFRAKHYFNLIPIDEHHTKMIQGEYWKGIFGKTYGKKIYKSVFEKFNTMNTKMKELLEKK